MTWRYTLYILYIYRRRNKYQRKANWNKNAISSGQIVFLYLKETIMENFQFLHMILKEIKKSANQPLKKMNNLRLAKTAFYVKEGI